MEMLVTYSSISCTSSIIILKPQAVIQNQQILGSSISFY
jgi:hypothetical protein